MPPTEDASSVSDVFEEALSQFLACIPQLAVQRAIGGVLRALLSGLQHDNLVTTVKYLPDKSSLEITLRASVIGTVATRSRVPGEWLLLPRIFVSMDDNTKGMGTKLRLQGIQVVPIQGATDAWKDLAAVFETNQTDTLDKHRSVAWQWWNATGRETYKGTKLWRVVESLALLGFGQAVPTYAKASLLLGCCLGAYQEVPSLYFRYNKDNNQVDVLGTLIPTEGARDPTSPKFNCNEELKDTIGLDLWEETISSPMKRATAAKCAPSSLNYAALFCARPDQELGASPKSVEKLFTVAQCFGGAGRVDVIKGKANSWQYNDETYQMTGNDGRIVWKPVNGNK